MGKTAFPGLMHHCDGGAWLEFLDIPGCVVSEDSCWRTMASADIVLEAFIRSMLERGIEIPAATDARDVKGGLCCVVVFEVDMDALKRSGGLEGEAVSHYCLTDTGGDEA